MPATAATRAELLATAKITPKTGETEKDFLIRLQKVISEDIEDAAWNALSGDAADWCNMTADNLMAGKDPVPLPGAEPAPTPAAAGRRRGAAAAAPAPAAPVVYTPAIGDSVTVTTKRGKVYEGIVVDFNEAEDFICINKDGEAGAKEDDNEYALTAVTVAKVTAQLSLDVAQEEEAAAADVAAAADEPAEPAAPEVDDTVKIVTSRDKTVIGKVVEVTDDLLVLIDSTGEENEYPIARLKSVTVTVQARKPVAAPAPAAAAAPAATGRRGRGAAAAPAAATAAPAAAEETPAGARKRSVNPGGVGPGKRIRELIASDFTMTEAQVEAQLVKEGIEFRPATVTMIYGDSHKFIEMLKAAKKLK